MAGHGPNEGETCTYLIRIRHEWAHIQFQVMPTWPHGACGLSSSRHWRISRHWTSSFISSKNRGWGGACEEMLHRPARRGGWRCSWTPRSRLPLWAPTQRLTERRVRAAGVSGEDRRPEWSVAAGTGDRSERWRRGPATGVSGGGGVEP